MSNEVRTILKSIVGIAVIFGALALSRTVSAQPAASRGFDKETEVGRWVRLWNTYNLDMVDELFLQDNRVTYFSSEKKGLIRGIEAVREHHRGFGFVPGGKKPASELWLENVTADDFGDTAIVTAIWYFGDRKKTENQYGPMTAVYVRSGNEYRIGHLNFSHY